MGSWLLASAGALCMTTALAQAPKAPATAADISVKQFFALAEYSSLALSPDGKKLAAIAPVKGRYNLIVVDLDTRKAHALTASDRWDVYQPQWIGNNRLYFQVINGFEVSGRYSFKGAYAIDADGANFREVFGYDEQGRRRGKFIDEVLSTEGKDSPVAYVALRERSREYPDVYKIDMRTMRAELLSFDSPGRTLQWLLDSKNRPRVAVREEPREKTGTPLVLTVWHRAADGEKWEKLFQESRYGLAGDGEDGDLCRIDSDDRTLYLSARRGRDKAAMWAMDLQTKEYRLVAEDPLVDIRCGTFIGDPETKKLAGFIYEADKPKFVAIDETASRVQQLRRIEAALGTVPARMSISKSGVGLVATTSATDAGTFYLFSNEKQQLEIITRARPWFEPTLMAERRFIQYKARDGLVIPAYLTVPKNSAGKKLPLIVNIHGGPMVRGYNMAQWGRWPEAQFFASRGYAVLEPEPRGSTGWGRKHFEASFKQWGLAMQDDITDGALHLVNEGIVDKQRMCLHGGSYGGYATLQGLVREADLFKCGNSFVAVTDLFLFQSLSYSDIAENSDYFDNEFTRLVGDSKRDREQFERTSPTRNADKIKAPVMLTMGSDDVRVPLRHGTAMRDALVAAGKPVDWKVYVGEGHGYNKEENVVDFYTRSLKFFDKHIGDRR
jgi:dipeptidyl aminopeptidase/acylaminoacyl peptidase